MFAICMNCFAFGIDAVNTSALTFQLTYTCSVPPRRQPYWYHPRVVRLSVIGHSQWLPHRHGTPYHNTFGMHPLFSSSAKNWRPFCSGRCSLTLYDNVLCFTCSPVIQCCSVTMYWLLQTDFVDTVRWSCSSSAIVPPKSYSFLLLLLVCVRMPNVMAEYRWRSLLNAAKLGWHPLLECRGVMLPRRETCWNLLGCPKLTNGAQVLVGRSSPYCKDMSGRYCCLTTFFPTVDTWRIVGDFCILYFQWAACSTFQTCISNSH